MQRRKFLSNMLGILPAYPFLNTLINPKEQKAMQVLPAELFKNGDSLLRPLWTKKQVLRNDQKLVDKLDAWSKAVILGQQRFELPLNKDLAFQISNIRLDVNSYVMYINAEHIGQILERAKGKTKSAELFLASDKFEVAYGALYWNKHIRRNRKNTELSKNIGKDFLVEEIYWLDVYYRKDKLIFNPICINYDSVHLKKEWTDIHTERNIKNFFSNHVPTFLPDDSIIIDWHKLAETFNLKQNLFYLRAAFRSKNFRQPIVSVNNFIGNVYNPKGNYGHIFTIVLNRWPTNKRNWKKFSSTNLLEGSNDDALLENLINSCFTLKVEPNDFNAAAGQGRKLNTNEQWENIVTSAPSWATMPKITFDDELDDLSIEGKEFLKYIEKKLGLNTKYLGKGLFQLFFTSGVKNAALEGNRGSPFQAGADYNATMTVSEEQPSQASVGADVVVSTVLTVVMFGGVLADANDAARKGDPYRQETRNVLREEAEKCASKTSTEGECRTCVSKSRASQLARTTEGENLNEDLFIENLIEVGASAVLGCGTAVGVVVLSNFLFPPSAAADPVSLPAACVAGLVIGAVIGGVGAYKNYMDTQREISDLSAPDGSAFAPCRELPLSIRLPNP